MNYGTGIGTGSMFLGGAGLATGQTPLLAVSVAMLVAATAMVVRRLPRKEEAQRP